MLKLEKNSNILVLAAHPDDETLGCGATLAKLSEEGHNIHLMTLQMGLILEMKKVLKTETVN